MHNDKQHMLLALKLAKLGIGYTSPNPNVGAVVVKDGKVIGEGFHLKAGQAHAEIMALNMAGPNAAGATLYVTLEPCNHYGKTPPCTTAIINSQIARVVIATQDINPLVSGSGIQTLQEAGIKVEVGLLEEEAKNLNRVFFHYISTRTPFITLKCGMSLDAKLATKTLESKWITSEPARHDAHSYRHSHDAILVGINTILADNPSLTYRGSLTKTHTHKKLLRIILDTHLRTPLDAVIVTDNLSPTWIVVGSEVPGTKIAMYDKVKIIQMPDKYIDLVKLIQKLGQLEITSILVEGGPAVLTSFIELGLFNHIVTYVAPIIIGGVTAPSFFMGSGYERLSKGIRLKYEHSSMIGKDLKLVMSKEET